MKSRTKLEFVQGLLDKKVIFLICHPESKAYCTFDDPTGGADIIERPDGGRSSLILPEGTRPGPMRTLLAFSEGELAEEYNEQELRSLGTIVEVVLDQKRLGWLTQLMLKGSIQHFTFDRTPGDAPLQLRYRAVMISLQAFLHAFGAYQKAARDGSQKILPWLPSESMIELGEDVQRIVRDENQS